MRNDGIILPLFYRSAPFLWKLKKTISGPVFKTKYLLSTAINSLSAQRRMLPDFVVIGVQKCGTSSIHRTLVQHPDIHPPIKKEVHFFDNPAHFHKGIDWYKAHFPSRDVRKNGNGLPITGEASPSYLLYPLVPKRMKEVLPDVKLIVMLRNPVDRAYSHYYHCYRPGREVLAFEEAIDLEEERLQGDYERLANDGHFWSPAFTRYSYLTRGRYAEQMNRWFEYFPREQFHIIDSTDYFKNEQHVYEQVLDFLGLPGFQPKGFKKKVYPFYEPMKPETRQRLIEYFKPYNQDLYRLLGREFDWDK